MHESRHPFRQDSLDTLKPDGNGHPPLVPPLPPKFTSGSLAGVGGWHGATDDDDDDECPLLDLCDRLADRFVRLCRGEDHPMVIRRRLERELRAEYGLDRERAEKLLDLTLEVLHLRTHGRYERSLAEIGYLIAFVTGGLEEAGDN